MITDMQWVCTDPGYTDEESYISWENDWGDEEEREELADMLELGGN